MWADGRRGQPVAIPRTDGLTYTVARSGRAIEVPDMRSHPLFVGVPEDWSGAIIGLPLKIGQRVVGVMNVSYQQAATFLPASCAFCGCWEPRLRLPSRPRAYSKLRQQSSAT